MNHFALLGRRFLLFAAISGGFILFLKSVRTLDGGPGIGQGVPGYWETSEVQAAATPSQSATIRGSVHIKSRIQPRSMAISIYSRRSTTPPAGPPPAAVNELENVVIYLEAKSREHRQSAAPPREEEFSPAASASTSSHPALSIRQVNETFVPHVLPIQVGSTVEFPNSDPFFHNVFSLSGSKSFDLGRYPQGQKRAVRFDKPGIVKVFCHIHSHMSAVILVFDHPFFTVPDSKGQFLYPSVPPGKYMLVGWHERLKSARLPLSVSPGETVAVDVVL